LKKSILERKRLRNILRILITAIILVLIFFLVKDLISNVNSITSITKSTGMFGPVVLILLTSLGIILTPIPSVALIVAAGYIYGTWLGGLYSYIGHLVAAIGTFAVVRTLNPEVKNKRYSRYRKLIEENKKILYLLYAIPVIPISIITIFASSLKIKWREFLKIIILSFAPTVLFFSYFGERISSKNLIEIGTLSLVILIGIFIVIRIINKRDKKLNNKEKDAKMA
jgi:uncharacterized membrane protein YdjX (TVP38/TMEM64 family)